MRRRRNHKLWNLTIDEFAGHMANEGSAKTLTHGFLKGRKFRMRRAAHLPGLLLPGARPRGLDHGVRGQGQGDHHSPSAPEAYRSLTSSVAVKRSHDVAMKLMRRQRRLGMGRSNSISGPIAQNHARVNRFLATPASRFPAGLPWTCRNTRTGGLNGWWAPRLKSDRSTPVALAPLRCGAKRDKIAV